eukprot:Opistho-2@44309
MALLNNEQRAANVIAKSESVECLTLGRTAFEKLLGPLESMKEKAKTRRDVLDEKAEAARSSRGTNLNHVGTDSPSRHGSEPVLDQHDSVSSKQKKLYFDGVNANHRPDVQLSDLKELVTLGRGAFGSVRLMHCSKTGETFAMKCLSMAKVIKLGQRQHVLNEKNVLSKMSHPFILKLYQTFKDQRNLYFLLEVCLGGEVFTLLRRRKKFSKSWAMFYGASVCLVLEYLHDHGIVYRDLKPENLLLDREGFLKVADFGFAKPVDGKSKTFTLCGTPDYIAPEVLKNVGHDRAADWWSYGVLIYEMLAGHAPFEGRDQMETYKKILSGKVNFGKDFNKNEMDLISKLLHVNQSKRLGNLRGGAVDIKRHKWFEGFDWEGLEKREMTPPYVPAVKSVTDASNFPTDYFASQKEDANEVKEDHRHLFEDF